MSANTLLISPTIIKERSIVNSNVDDKLIYSSIKAAQDLFIHPILGTALFEKIQARIEANDWTGFTNYKALLDNRIIDTLVYYTLAEMPITSFQFTNKGLMRKQGDNTENPGMSEIFDIVSHYQNKAESYAKRLRLYLIEKAPTMFPEYLNPGNTIDTIIPEQSDFTMPIYLGEDSNSFCNPGGFTGQPYSE